MSAVIIDANVVIKWYIEDELSDQARAVSAQRDLVAPWLILAETANGLWKYVRAGRMTLEDASLAVASLPRSIEIVPDADMAAQAVQLAAQLGHPAYDCFYLALAQRRGLPLLTADRRLAALAEGVGVPAIFPEAVEADRS